MFVLNYYVKTIRKQKENGIFNKLGKRHLLKMVPRNSNSNLLRNSCNKLVKVSYNKLLLSDKIYNVNTHDNI